MLFLKRKAKTVISDEDTEQDAPSYCDFIPYYCHYNPNTILTKNGELMQIIKISSNTQGLNYESISSDKGVRETIRQAITSAIDNDHYSICFHTIRQRKPIEVSSHYDIPFASHVNKQWQGKNDWNYEYYNEVYISILYEGQSAELLHPIHLKNTLLIKQNRIYRNNYLDNIHKTLEKTVAEITATLQTYYNAHVLGIVERLPSELMPDIHEPVLYSEPMEFLGQIMNLSKQPYLLPDAEIGQAINDRAIIFGYNALESKSTEGKRRFGSILTLKKYHEAPLETIDRILQAPLELIVTQSFNFISSRKALKTYRDQKEWFDISGDNKSKVSTGLNDILRSHKKRPIDFGEQQTSIMVVVDDYKQLEPDILKAQEIFGSFGMTTIREDIMLEECFWAQLPGNIEFIRRKDIVSTDKAAGFTRLNRFPAGNHSGTHWHEPLAVIPTQVDSPYFFNFHQQDNGHTVLFDFNSFNDSYGKIIRNFLLTSSCKYDGRLFIFDQGQSTKLLFDKLETPYYALEEESKLHINPFNLEHNQRNSSFLLAWFGYLLTPVFRLEDHHKNYLRDAIEQTYELAAEQRHIRTFMESVSKYDPLLSEALQKTLNEITGCVFSDKENYDLNQRAISFNFDAIMHSNPAGSVAIFAYLMHRIITALDGKPTIIVLNEAVSFLENSFFAPRLESLLEMLKQNNVMVVSHITSPQSFLKTSCMSTLLNCCATKLYVPDEIRTEYNYPEIDLGQTSNKLLQAMQRESGDFLLKQGDETVALRVNLDAMPDSRAILANDIKTLITAGGEFSAPPKT